MLGNELKIFTAMMIENITESQSQVQKFENQLSLLREKFYFLEAENKTIKEEK